MTREKDDMKKTAVFLLFVLLSLFGETSLFASSDYGTTAANFLKVPVAPVPSGMGQAYTAMYGTDSVLYNPAALSMMSYSSISGAHNQYFMNMTQEYLASNLRFSFGTIAASYSSFSSGKFQGYDSEDHPYGDISAQFSSISLTFSKSWPYFPDDRNMIDSMLVTPYWTRLRPVEDFRPKTYRFAIGASVKNISEKLDDSTANTFAFDAGAMLILPGHWQFGFSSMNNGGEVKHAVQSFPLPSVLRLGVAKDIHTKGDVMIFTFAADGVKYKDSDAYINSGLEVNIASVFQARVGYTTQNDVLSSLTAGAGLSLDLFGVDGFMKGARIDYAFVNYSDFGATHRIGFQVIW